VTSFEQLYREHFRYVWRSLRRLGVSESEIQDATQDVFVVAHAKLPEFQRRSKLSTWLFAICYRHALERHRRRRKQPEPIEAVVDSVADQAAVPVEALQRNEGLKLLARILDQMSVEQRAVFVLYELEELDGEEIAATLALPRGTVHSRLRAAREHFFRVVGRERLREERSGSRAGGVR
jgi:RNA polymerase sigma-70 factor, ECF subfamily